MYLPLRPNVYFRSTPRPRPSQPARRTIIRSVRLSRLIGWNESHHPPIDIGFNKTYNHPRTEWQLRLTPRDHGRILQLDQRGVLAIVQDHGVEVFTDPAA